MPRHAPPAGRGTPACAQVTHRGIYPRAQQSQSAEQLQKQQSELKSQRVSEMKQK